MKPDWKRAILGGFVGTLALTFMMYKGAPMLGMMKLDMAPGSVNSSAVGRQAW